MTVGNSLSRACCAMLVVVVVPLVGCTPRPTAVATSQATSTMTNTTTTTAAPTTTPRPTIAVTELAPLAERASLAPNGLKDLGGVMEEESAEAYPEAYALTEVCDLRLLADRETYVDHYRHWRVSRGGYVVKNFVYAYHNRTAVEVIGELISGLGPCDEWIEIDDTTRKLVRNVAVDPPASLSAFLAFCQDSPDGTKRYACVAYLGHGNLVSRVSVARLDYGPRALDALQALLPRAAQALLTA